MSTYCSSTNIPNFRKGIFTGVAPMYCELCLDCGEILRLYIKENTDKKWQKNEYQL